MRRAAGKVSRAKSTPFACQWSSVERLLRAGMGALMATCPLAMNGRCFKAQVCAMSELSTAPMVLGEPLLLWLQFFHLQNGVLDKKPKVFASDSF